MLNKLYKVSEKLSRSKLYEHFINLLGRFTADIYDDIKRAYRLTAKKMIKQLKLDGEENMNEVEDDDVEQ